MILGSSLLIIPAEFWHTYNNPREIAGGVHVSAAANSHARSSSLYPCGVRSTHSRWPYSPRHRYRPSTGIRWHRYVPTVNSRPPPPAASPPTLAEGVAGTVRSAGASATFGVIAASPGLPWETLWATLARWLESARGGTRTLLRPTGRVARALPFLAPLFSRIAGEDLLENPARARVHEAIAQEPGLSMQDVRDRAGIAWGTTVHHLARLEHHGLVVSVRDGGSRRYFPANTTAARYRRELSALAHPTTLALARAVAQSPGIDQKGLCAGLGLLNPAASKHLARLGRMGLVEAVPVGRSRRYQPTPRLADVLAQHDAVTQGIFTAEARTPAPAPALAVPHDPVTAARHLPLVDAPAA